MMMMMMMMVRRRRRRRSVGVDIVSAMLGQINLVSYVPEHLERLVAF